MSGKEITAPGDDLAQLMRVAVDKGEAGVAALERLVAMRERAEDRAAVRLHAEAVARFQAACPTVGKGAKGAHGAAYAPLDQIMDTIRPHLADAGLSVTFDSEELEDERLRVIAIVHHEAGHSERAAFTVSREAKSSRMNDTQRDGSALTYGRRYALGLALGIVTGVEVDDDGAGAGRADDPEISDEQAANLLALAQEVGADLDKFLRWAQVSAISEIKVSRYQKCVDALERKR